MSKFYLKNSSKYFLLSFFLIIIDFCTKQIVKHNMEVSEKIYIIKNFFAITYVQNRGGAFGVFQNKKTYFLIFSIVALFFILYLFFTMENKYYRLAYSLMIAGAIGNMIDRFFYGYVVDMFDFFFFWKYVFNFADILIVIAIFILFILIILEKDEEIKES